MKPLPDPQSEYDSAITRFTANVAAFLARCGEEPLQDEWHASTPYNISVGQTEIDGEVVHVMACEPLESWQVEDLLERGTPNVFARYGPSVDNQSRSVLLRRGRNTLLLVSEPPAREAVA